MKIVSRRRSNVTWSQPWGHHVRFYLTCNTFFQIYVGGEWQGEEGTLTQTHWKNMQEISFA